MTDWLRTNLDKAIAVIAGIALLASCALIVNRAMAFPQHFVQRNMGADNVGDSMQKCNLRGGLYGAHNRCHIQAYAPRSRAVQYKVFIRSIL